MKKIIYLFFSAVLFFPALVHAQVEKVIVETYYVSDMNDASDTTDDRSLEAGSKTYRIYIGLAKGSRLNKLYGDANHTLRITSTANFFNNIDRPDAYFGYLISKSWFPYNPTIALDSWLTLGLAAQKYRGVLKTDDTDSSFIGGTKNYGGSTGNPEGLLDNNDPAAGIPITIEDGMVPNDSVFGRWADKGFKDETGLDTTAFGADKIGNEFISNDAFLQQVSGVTGANPDSNRVLIAQVTTKGEISFELNLEVEQPDTVTGGTVIVNYVAKGNDTTYSTGSGTVTEKFNAYLSYPPACGCRDAKYIEYNKNAVCDDNTACKTHVIFGCMDPQSCNYNPQANFNVPELCCYPGHCNDRDLAVVCSGVNNNRSLVTGGYDIYPNPAYNEVNIEFLNTDGNENKYELYDAFGRLITEKSMGIINASTTEKIDISAFAEGIYIVRVSNGNTVSSKMFVKN